MGSGELEEAPGEVRTAVGVARDDEDRVVARDAAEHVREHGVVVAHAR